MHVKNDCFDVLIIGAGPAGLTAGYTLTKKSDLSVCILEANASYVGGISRTESYKGYLFDIGGHRFFSKSEQIEALWRELLPDGMIERPRLSRIYYQGKFYHYPLRAFEALRNLGIWESGLCVLSYVKARLFPITPAVSLQDWVTNKFGSRLFRIFFKTYTEKVWGISCSELSADWAAQRIRGLNLSQAVISALMRSLKISHLYRRKDKVIKTLIEKFRYPSKGPGMLWTATATKIQAAGGQIEMGIRAKTFVWSEAEKLWSVTVTTADGQEKVYQARHVISSAPLRETIAAITPQLACANQIMTLRYRDFILVALILKTSPAFQDNWIYVHDPRVKVGRIQNFSAWSPEMVPEGGHGCLGMEFFCQEGDDFWQKTDADLIAFAKKELEHLNLATSDQIVDGCVVRQPKAYPVYDGEYRPILESLKKELNEHYPTFHVVGRNGMHKYNNQDHAMMTALLTVENIIAGKRVYDVWAVNEDAEYHEEVVS